jgi:hypothetical protein
MSFRDQKKYLEALKKHEKEFTREEAQEYSMFLKRQKDDEDFDTLSMKKLKEMYDKYNVVTDVSKYDKYFKKKEE